MGHREDLLAGARQCLYEKGYARTTARDIVAVSGTNLGSIGYHYGSTKALMNAAMLSAVDEWGQKITAALIDDLSDSGDDQLVRLWRRIISTARADRELFMATVEAMVQAEHAPELREQMAGGIQQGRSGMAAMILQQPEETLDAETIGTLGSVQMALMSGVLIQHMTDPANAPTAEQVVAGIRALASTKP
ncbi:TetR/AcrR family transcriptional regulator [Actinoplanes sp. NPDC049265]|uniref:TetR/AcrR family transcriptional regulator n=1 Tax=Actinoplanes sp. NPDC049265 TaxID=3363902 RepID=UPI0037156BB3